MLASQEVPAPPQDHPIVLSGGTVHTVSGETLEDAQVLMDAGKIRAVGRNLSLPGGTQIVDVRGKHVYPGLISPNTVLGLVEIGAVRATVDTSEPGAVNPNARAEVSINPDSELLPVARANGILTALSVPQPVGGDDNPGSGIAGTSALIKLDGWTWEDMTLSAPVGLHVFWPQMTINRDPRFPKSPEDQQVDLDKRLRQLRDTFATARAYLRGKQAAARGTPLATDLRWEAMTAVMEGKIPVFVHANEIKQIKAALEWTADEQLRMVLVGGQDAWRVADLLKVRDIPVIISSVLSLPERRWEAYDTPFTNPLKLQKAGVRFCIANDGSAFAAPQDRNLPYQAGMAAAYGLPKEEALKAITLYPAQILGMGARLGSIDVGKDATVLVTTGDPLEITSRVEMAYIQGREIDLANRQKRLYEKYRRKYEQIRSLGRTGGLTEAVPVAIPR